MKERQLKAKEDQVLENEKDIAKKIEIEVKSIIEARENVLRAREEALKEEKKSIDKKVQDEIDIERKKIEIEARKKAEEAVSTEVKDIQEQLKEKQEKLDKAEQAELQLRKRERDLEQKEKNVELEMARRMTIELQKVREETAKVFEEEHRLKDAEKEKKLQDAIKANEELRRKLQQGSQQTQGEVLELEIEELIRTNFPLDFVEPVPKGINGADVIHHVQNRKGDQCGIIVWELKHTKAWSDGWMQKLKDDLRLMKGNVAILVTEALPKGIENFGLVNGVWVTCHSCALGLAMAIRGQLIEVAVTKLSAIGKNEKMEVLYRYISGPEFRQKIEAIVESFVEMQKDLQTERRATEVRWSKREKQIQRVIANTTGTYGDFQGYIGSSLQTIPALSDGVDDEAEDISSPLESGLGKPSEEDIDTKNIPF